MSSFFAVGCGEQLALLASSKNRRDSKTKPEGLAYRAIALLPSQSSLAEKPANEARFLRRGAHPWCKS
jgi:hypothetical protein